MTAIEAIDQIRSDYQARYGTPVEERIETGRVRDFRGLDLAGDRITARGRIASLEADRLRLEVWIENSRGERSTNGAATVEFA